MCKQYLDVQFRLKIDSRKLSPSLIGSFFDRTNFFQANGHFFRKFQSSLEVSRSKRKFSDNLVHNILELYNILIGTPLTTSKTRLDI